MRNDMNMNCGGCYMSTENLSQSGKEEALVSFGDGMIALIVNPIDVSIAAIIKGPA